MARRRSIPDARKVGRSHVVPYRRGERASDRHARRLRTNVVHEQAVRRWCEQNGFTYRITNDNHHWQFRNGTFLAEWWPSSAKLVINKSWHAGIHCHDFQQALAVIADAWKRHPMQGPCVREPSSARGNEPEKP